MSSPFRRLRAALAMSLLLCAQAMVWPSESLADLVAVGDRSTPSYKIGVALSALVTLDSSPESINLNVLPSNDLNGDHLQSVVSRLADFAVLDAGQLNENPALVDQFEVVQAVAIVRNIDGQMTILVTHQDEEEQRIRAVIQALFKNTDKLATLLSATVTTDPAPALTGLDLELHQAAARFYEEARQGGTTAVDGSDGDVDTEASRRPISQFEVEAEVLTRERDGLAEQLKTLSAQQQAMEEQLSEAEQGRQLALTELETLKETASQHDATLAQLRAELEIALNERDKASTRRDELQRRIDNVDFASIEQASKSAEDMRLRAEKAEARYEEVFKIGEACLLQRQGGSSQARQALLQIEQMEERLQQATLNHRQCLAELEASAN